jgi:hypothetical protein
MRPSRASLDGLNKRLAQGRIEGLGTRGRVSEQIGERIAERHRSGRPGHVGRQLATAFVRVILPGDRTRGIPAAACDIGDGGKPEPERAWNPNYGRAFYRRAYGRVEAWK